MLKNEVRKQYPELGEHLKLLIWKPRTGKELTYEQIGKSINVRRSAVHYWAEGRNRPTRENLLNLCGLLNTSVEELETAFTLAGYCLTPDEVDQYKSWLKLNPSVPGFESYEELEQQLEAVKGLRSGATLSFGLIFSKDLAAKLYRHVKEEGVTNRLLTLYFLSLEEVTQYHRYVTPLESLKAANQPLFLEMRRICEDTNDSLLKARLQAAQGDEQYITGSFRSSFRTLKSVNSPSLLASLDPDIQISHILGGSCLALAQRRGTTEEFESLIFQLEGALDKSAGKISGMLIVHGLERLSRAYAKRYRYTLKQEYKRGAIQKLEDAESLIRCSTGYPIYGLRVPKARLELVDCGVLEGFTQAEQIVLARDARRQAEEVRDARSFKQMDDFLNHIEDCGVEAKA